MATLANTLDEDATPSAELPRASAELPQISYNKTMLAVSFHWNALNALSALGHSGRDTNQTL